MKLSVEQFVNEMNHMSSGNEEELDYETVVELHHLYVNMFMDNCGVVPEFEVTNRGKILLKKDVN